MLVSLKVSQKWNASYPSKRKFQDRTCFGGSHVGYRMLLCPQKEFFFRTVDIILCTDLETYKTGSVLEWPNG